MSDYDDKGRPYWHCICPFCGEREAVLFGDGLSRTCRVCGARWDEFITMGRFIEPRCSRRMQESPIAGVHHIPWHFAQDQNVEEPKAIETTEKEETHMSKELQVFSFEEKKVRVVMKGNTPWWIAKDVCDVLELSNAREAIKALDDDEKSTVRISDGAGGPERNAINESGMYALIMRSNKPEAKRFRKWVTSEVLPQLMRTGSYSVKGKDKGRGNPDDAQRLELARRRLEIQQRNTDARMAKIMQRMVESPAYALTQESKQILAHEITHLATGREHAAMLPDAGTRFYTAKQVGDDAGVSNRRVMKTAREMGLVAPEGSANEYGRWKMSKSAHGPHECAQWVFSEEGRRRVLEAIADAA